MLQQSRATLPKYLGWEGRGGGGYPPRSVQNIVDCTGHIIGGHNIYAKFVVDSFFDTMNDLEPENKLVDLHMFDGDSACRKD